MSTDQLSAVADALDRRAANAEDALRDEPRLPVRDLAVVQRVLALVLRSMETRYVEHIAGQAPVATAGCVCHFCEHRRAVLLAVDVLSLSLVEGGAVDA